MPNVIIVVVTYNGIHCIDRCLQSIQDSEGVPNLHAVVVDNASTDDTLRRALLFQSSNPDRFTVFPCAINAGFGVGNNIGISWAINRGADYILLLNQDALLQAGTVSELVTFMESHPEYGVVSPLHMSPDWNHVDSKTFVGYLRHHADNYLKDAILERIKDHYCIHGINAAAWLLRRNTVMMVGGFDPLFFMYAEDDDYLARMAYHKIDFALVPSSRILHLRESPKSTSKNIGFFDEVSKYRRREISRITYLAKDLRSGTGHAMLLVLTHGLFNPLVEWMNKRNHRQILGIFGAFVMVVLNLRSIHKARQLTSAPGPTYLNTSNN